MIAKMRLIRRALKALVWVLGICVVIFLAAVWYYADMLRDKALSLERDPTVYDLRVAAVGDETITLEPVVEDPTDRWEKAGVWGLEWEGGYGRIKLSNTITKESPTIHQFTIIKDEPSIGTLVTVDGFAFRGDPKTTRGVTFEDVVIQSFVGNCALCLKDFPAWFTQGTQDPWVIFVHGKGSNRAEALRILKEVSNAGYPTLSITYRNDEGLAQSESGFYGYGATEWKDLEAAVAFARDAGAENIVLYGFSMGGAIVTSYLVNSEEQNGITGAILDSPALSLEAAIDHGAEQTYLPVVGGSLPRPLTSTAKLVAKVRFGLDLDRINYLQRADELTVPILLIQGDIDDTVPAWTSRQLATTRPDIVTYLELANVGHVEGWNMEQRLYERTVLEFLSGQTK